MAEIEPQAEDGQVLKIANELKAILLTRDKGFGQMVFRQGRPFHGVLLLRLAGVPMLQRKELLAQALKSHGHEFEGSFSVLTQNGLRVRPRFPGPESSE